MTKGRTENNRAWEKERRDRLNKSFDILAKFLPNYDDAMPFSKIEIIQKSVLLIKELQLQLKEALAEKQKEILKSVLELEEAFKVLIVRNKVLLAIVKKCGETAPPFTGPKIFNYIVTNPLNDTDLDELYVKQNGRPPKNSRGKTTKKLQTLYDDGAVLQKKKKIKSNKKDDKKKVKSLVPDNGSESVTDFPVQEPKEKSINTKESEPLDKPKDKLSSTKSESKVTDQVKPSLTTPMVATGILLPISNAKKPMNLDAGPIIVVNALPKVSAIMPKPVTQKQIPGKVAIKPLKMKTVPRRQRIRRTKKELEQERKSTEESKLQVANNEITDSDGSKFDKTRSEESRTTDVAIEENDLSKTPDIQPDNNRIETTEPTLPTLPQPELSNDILASLQIPQNDSNNESMSPTAAFLMSFPVVSSAGVRIGDEEHETHDAQTIQHSHSASKPTNESNILANISSLMTTKDYERFFEDAVKTDANEKSLKDSQNDLDKRGSMSFDFQLKPIISSCTDIKLDGRPRMSVTYSSTYQNSNPKLEINYKGSPLPPQNNLLSGTQSRAGESILEFVHSRSPLGFIKATSAMLNSTEPPTKMLRLTDTSKERKTETTSFDNLYLRNPPATSTITTTNSFTSIYSYDKATTATEPDSRTTATESVNFNVIPSIPTTTPRAAIDISLSKPEKLAEKPKESFNFTQSFVSMETIEPTSSVKHCSENQLNSLYSYPTNTGTFSSPSSSHISSNNLPNNLKTFQESSAKSTSIEKPFLKPNHSTTSAADGFYTSLTSIGTTPQYPSSIMRPNMYSSALSLSSSSNQKALDYAPQTPFTFSLTTPLNTTSTAKSATLPSCQQSQNYLPTTQTHSTSYQTYNPFAFENISSMSAPLPPYSFSLTSTTNKITSKNPSQSSFSIDQNFLTETRIKPIIPVKEDTHLEKKTIYKHCPKDESTHSEQIKTKDLTQKVERSNTRQLVNWMTSTTDPQKNEYPLIPPIDYTQSSALSNHYLPQPASQLSNSQKNSEIYFAPQIGEENFQWSPNKLIDAPNINSSTLPNLHGDLALNNSTTPKPQAITSDKTKTRQMNHQQQNVVTNAMNSCFSVSQLVDHPKSSGQSKPYDDSTLQPKTSKTSSNQLRFKQKDSKKIVKPPSNMSNFTPNIFVESFAYNEPQKQNQTNSIRHTAEALFSIRPSLKESKSLSNFVNQSEYCNQSDTFNNVDYLNESNYNYYNNSYFAQIPENEYFCSGTYPEQQFHNKSTRNSGSSTKHLTTIGDSTGYGSHSSQNNLYSFSHPSGKLCQQPSQYKSCSQLTTSYNQSRSYSNTNKKQFKEDLFPSYDPNSASNYFTPSLNINTPIIPHPPLIPTPHNIPSNEDFNYSTHLNYPSSLSKTSTYATIQQISDNTQMLHSNVGGTAGNLVTDFNLSTICPEINDKTRQQSW